jgi:hypothetical protein
LAMSVVHRRYLQQSGGKPCLQALHPQPLSGATASFGRHDTRLHPVARRFRSRYEDEFCRRRTNLLCGLSCTARRGKPGEMLELVSHSRPAAGHGREAALRAPTLIREDRTQRGKCCVSSSSIRSHSNQVRVRPYLRVG